MKVELKFDFAQSDNSGMLFRKTVTDIPKSVYPFFRTVKKIVSKEKILSAQFRVSHTDDLQILFT